MLYGHLTVLLALHMQVPLKKSSAQMVLPRPQGHQSSGASPAPQNQASSGSGVPMSLVEAPSARRNLAANLELSEITHSLGLLNMDTSAGAKKERDMFVKPKLDMQHHLESIAERRQREQLLMEGRGLIRIIRVGNVQGLIQSMIQIHRVVQLSHCCTCMRQRLQNVRQDKFP